ncbi:hypothetical protein ONZ45_g10482 [Pleurotus djamor]|nr:hypothetical protein ONZ45_g10482 [Pleurotus djamor]
MELPQLKASPRTYHSVGASIGITELRGEIGIQMNAEFIETDFTTFGSAYLPFEPDESHVDTVMDYIHPMVLVSDGDHFSKFPEPPVAGVDTEASYFKGLVEIAKAVGEAPPPRGRERNEFEFCHCPTTTITSAIPASNNLIDACIIRKSSESVHVQAISCPFEFNIERAQKFEIKITSANIQIMNDDPRRTFTYGITIVSDAVTVWYFSRSHSAVSESFSIIKEPRKLVKLLIAFFYSTEEELGYDPDVERDSEGRYVFTLPQRNGPPRRFRTSGSSISEYRPNIITGRMTRVWLVTEHWDDPIGATDYVLKDVWLGISDRTEKQVQTAIFAGIDDFLKSDPQGHPFYDDDSVRPSLKDVLQGEVKYKDYFMTIVTDHRGQTSKALAKPAWRKTDLFSMDLVDHVPTHKQSQAIERAPTGETPRPLEGQTSLPIAYRRFAPRRQYRVVFEEFCIDVGSLSKLGEVVDVLEQTLFALRLLFCAGWVHRDISCGNILAHKTSGGSWQAKLSDLEYARKYPSEDASASHDPKTGTPPFMPVEILQSEFIYVPPTHDDDGVDDIPTVVHNFQHDLESVYWILLWSSTLRTAVSLTSNGLPLRSFSEVFSCTMGASPARKHRLCRHVMKPKSDMDSLPPPMRATFSLINDIRSHLYKQYWQREVSNRLQDPMSFTAIHLTFAALFARLKPTITDWDCSDLIRRSSTVLTAQTRRAMPSDLKRRLTKDDDEYVPEDTIADSSEESNPKKSKVSPGTT